MTTHNTPRPRRMALLAWAAVLLLPALAVAEPPEGKMLLKPVNMALTELNPQQAMILDRVKAARETVGDVKVVKLAGDPADMDKAPLLFELPGVKDRLVLKGYKVTDDDGTRQLEWAGDKASAHLTFVGQSVHGMIYARDKVYQVQPIGRGIHVVSQVDQSKLKDEPPAVGKRP